MPIAPELRSVLIHAAREFNAGHYFEAHDVLEDALEIVPDELWELFVGLIQIAVGYHKLGQGLLAGAARMLALGLAKVEPFAPDAAGVQLDALRAHVRADLAQLQSAEFNAEQCQRNPPRLQFRV